jgi:hypothetical protein
MTAKQKANELFDKINIHIPINASFKDLAEEASWKIEKDHLSTKKIALIAVDEILNTGIFATKDYWQEVRLEIEKL